MSLTDFDNAVASRIQDAVPVLNATDRYDAIAQAVKRYSKDRPREVVSDVQGNGTALLDLPTGANDELFEDGFSQIRSIEFPIGDIPPTVLEDDSWRLYRTPTGLKIQLSGSTPSGTDDVRITWTLRHSVGNNVVGAGEIASTIPDSDFDAVCDLAGAICAEKLAAYYAQTRDPSITADSVNYRTKSQEYLTLAKMLRGRYDAHVGIMESGAGGGGTTPGAIAMGDMELRQGSGVERLTHRRR